MSSTESIRQTVSTYNVMSPVGAEVMKEVRGEYRGEQVTLASESSKLADAAEELGMSVAHRADKKSLHQREVRQGRGTDIEALSRIADFYDKLPNMPRDADLKRLVDQLQQFEDLMSKSGSGSGAPTKEDILEALARFDGDVTHQFAGLEVAREFFEASGASSEFMALLDSARSSYEETGVARDVRAGFAVADIANKAAATLETDPAAVRDSYRNMLRETPSFAQLFENLKKYDLGAKFSEVIETFREAAGRDLASTGPSTDPDFLHSLLTELSKLKKLQSVVDLSTQMLSSVGRLIPPDQKEGQDGISMTGRLLAFASKSVVGLGDARQLLGPMDDSKTPASTQLALANGIRSLHGELPDDIMPSPQARLQQSTTIVSLLDSLVDKEEEEFQEKKGGKKKQDDKNEGMN